MIVSAGAGAPVHPPAQPPAPMTGSSGPAILVRRLGRRGRSDDDGARARPAPPPAAAPAARQPPADVSAAGARTSSGALDAAAADAICDTSAAEPRGGADASPRSSTEDFFRRKKVPRLLAGATVPRPSGATVPRPDGAGAASIARCRR